MTLLQANPSELGPDILLDRQGIEAARRSAFAIATHAPEDFTACARRGASRPKCSISWCPRSSPASTTAQLDRLAYEFVMDHGALPACVGYRGYRHTLCTSVNEVVCHGIPNEHKPLRDGDILNIDVTVIVDGWHGDTSRMYYVGDVKRKGRRLCEITYEAMMRGIAAAKPGATTGDIGHAIQSFAEGEEHCAVVRDFCGHGVGRVFHALPNIVHYGRPGQGVALKPGMFFTVEPMINLGGYAVKVKDDGWTAVTRDRSLSAQFEHSVGITETGVEIFTEFAQRAALPALCLKVAGRKTANHRRIITAIVSDCAGAFFPAAAMHWPITNCWNSCCSPPFRCATSSRWPSN